jgi:hypothetical protein
MTLLIVDCLVRPTLDKFETVCLSIWVTCPTNGLSDQEEQVNRLPGSKWFQIMHRDLEDFSQMSYLLKRELAPERNVKSRFLKPVVTYPDKKNYVNYRQYYAPSSLPNPEAEFFVGLCALSQL